MNRASVFGENEGRYTPRRNKDENFIIRIEWIGSIDTKSRKIILQDSSEGLSNAEDCKVLSLIDLIEHSEEVPMYVVVVHEVDQVVALLNMQVKSKETCQ